MIIRQNHVNKAEIAGACLRVWSYFYNFVQITDTEVRAHQTLNEGGHWIHDQIKKVTK